MALYKGIHHLSMATQDLQKTVRFWRDLLGFRLVIGMGKPGYRHYFFEVSSNNLISFFEWPEVRPVEEKDHGVPVKGPFVFDHISFEVAREEDLRDLKGKLEAAKFWVSDVIDHGFILSIYSFDPNGIPIEFSWAVPGVDVRADPIMIDSSPHPAALEGPEPQEGRWPLVERALSREEVDTFPGEGRELVEGLKKNWWREE